MLRLDVLCVLMCCVFNLKFSVVSWFGLLCFGLVWCLVVCVCVCSSLCSCSYGCVAVCVCVCVCFRVVFSVALFGYVPLWMCLCE